MGHGARSRSRAGVGAGPGGGDHPSGVSGYDGDGGGGRGNLRIESFPENLRRMLDESDPSVVGWSEDGNWVVIKDQVKPQNGYLKP